jgi:hypothetical protein
MIRILCTIDQNKRVFGLLLQMALWCLIKCQYQNLSLQSSPVEESFEHRLWVDMKFIGFNSNEFFFFFFFFYENEVDFVLQQGVS